MKRLVHDIFRVSCYSQGVMSDACQFLGQTIEKVHAKISRGEEEASFQVQNWQIFKVDKATLSSKRRQAGTGEERGELVTLPNSNQEPKFAI